MVHGCDALRYRTSIRPTFSRVDIVTGVSEDPEAETHVAPLLNDEGLRR